MEEADKVVLKKNMEVPLDKGKRITTELESIKMLIDKYGYNLTLRDLLRIHNEKRIIKCGDCKEGYLLEEIKGRMVSRPCPSCEGIGYKPKI